jgi:hypothetical protein
VNVVSCENHARFSQYLSENLQFVPAFHPRRLLCFLYCVGRNCGNTHRPFYFIDICECFLYFATLSQRLPHIYI